MGYQYFDTVNENLDTVKKNVENTSTTFNHGLKL